MKKILTSIAVATSLLSVEAQIPIITVTPVVIAWNPILSPASIGPLVTYNAGWGTNSRVYAFTNSTTNASLTITNLTPGTTWYFAVSDSASNALTSPWSAEVTATTSWVLVAPTGVTETVIIFQPMSALVSE